jgi:hypothetical protein
MINSPIFISLYANVELFLYSSLQLNKDYRDFEISARVFEQTQSLLFSVLIRTAFRSFLYLSSFSFSVSLTLTLCFCTISHDWIVPLPH